MRPPHQTAPFIRPWPVGHPSVTAVLIALLAATGTAQWFFTLLDAGRTVQESAVIDWLGLSTSTVNEGRYWQFASFMVLQIGPFPLHLIANLAGLYFAGREVEPIVGGRHFLGIFFAGNLFGGLVHWLAGMQGWVPADMALVGISAGVMAVLAAFATILPELDLTVMLFFVLPVRTRAKLIALTTVFVAAALWATQTALTIGPDAMVAGALMGWIYAKQLGFGSPFAIQRFLHERRLRAARLARMPIEQFICEEIDPILDKIAREGIQSLSRAERRLLERGRERIAARSCAG